MCKAPPPPFGGEASKQARPIPTYSRCNAATTAGSLGSKPSAPIESLNLTVAGWLMLKVASRATRMPRRSTGRGRPQTAGQVEIEQMSADIAIVEEARVESIAEVLL